VGTTPFDAEALDEALSEWDAAVQLLRNVSDLDVHSRRLLVTCMSNSIQVCLRRNDFNRALRLATEILAVDPIDATALTVICQLQPVAPSAALASETFIFRFRGQRRSLRPLPPMRRAPRGERESKPLGQLLLNRDSSSVDGRTQEWQ